MEYNFYTCGAKMEDFATESEDNPDYEILQLLFIRSHLCMDKSNSLYPICVACKENGSSPINKRKRSIMQIPT